ncbi:hypothetical protein Thimo_3233 [Thioflavicoccus mobilis 8321]|uniref:Tetratricopeptide repeat protein n=1 Tax=Thioflavicoccus mobilis 8321 TaxID=765912 RepID=L0H123_9GAMM|nr:hypothetical protein [Thioflavicoccus mobilis]AGA91911.1 hypothetical protein Thimo_3233 [Thioflavicoccus mobilis 8321]
MDLLDFSGEDMYFDRPLPAGVADLLAVAAAQYGEAGAELGLLRAYFLAPEHLSVLVALYRFYYYQQRYEDALIVADRAIGLAACELGLDPDWRRLTATDLERPAREAMAQTRFLLLALKGAGYLLMRLGRAREALARFETVAAVDTADRLGLKELLAWARNAVGAELAQEAGGNVRALRPR